MKENAIGKIIPLQGSIFFIVFHIICKYNHKIITFSI